MYSYFPDVHINQKWIQGHAMQIYYFLTNL